MAVQVTVETTVNAPAAKAWDMWNKPEHVMKWNAASPDWHCPKAASDLREGGRFSSRMEARDGSMGFDFAGTYTKVVPNKILGYAMSDGRKVEVIFSERDGKTHVLETFDAETENPVEMQKAGWQSILDNYKKYVEAQP